MPITAGYIRVTCYVTNNFCSVPSPATHPCHVLVRYFLPFFLLSSHILTLDSTIFGRAIKNEYLSIGVLSTAFGTAWLATRGGSEAEKKPATVQQAKESVKINAGSSYVFFLLSFGREMAG